MKHYTIEEVYNKELRAKGTNIDDFTKTQAILYLIALTKLPKNVVDYALKNIMFMTTNNIFWGINISAFGMKQRRLKQFVILSHNLWIQKQQFIDHTIAHEIAHAYLKHDDEIRSTEDIKKSKRKTQTIW